MAEPGTVTAAVKLGAQIFSRFGIGKLGKGPQRAPVPADIPRVRREIEKEQRRPKRFEFGRDRPSQREARLLAELAGLQRLFGPDEPKAKAPPQKPQTQPRTAGKKLGRPPQKVGPAAPKVGPKTAPRKEIKIPGRTPPPKVPAGTKPGIPKIDPRLIRNPIGLIIIQAQAAFEGIKKILEGKKVVPPGIIIEDIPLPRPKVEPKIVELPPLQLPPPVAGPGTVKVGTKPKLKIDPKILIGIGAATIPFIISRARTPTRAPSTPAQPKVPAQPKIPAVPFAQPLPFGFDIASGPPLTIDQLTQPEAARLGRGSQFRCPAVNKQGGRKRRKKDERRTRCFEGFFREFSDTEDFTVWREVNCLTRKALR